MALGAGISSRTVTRSVISPISSKIGSEESLTLCKGLVREEAIVQYEPQTNREGCSQMF